MESDTNFSIRIEYGKQLNVCEERKMNGGGGRIRTIEGSAVRFTV